MGRANRRGRDAGDLAPRGARRRRRRALTPRRDVLQAHVPSVRHLPPLVGAAARERQEVRGRARKDRAASPSWRSCPERRAVASFERNDRAVLVVLDGPRGFCARRMGVFRHRAALGDSTPTSGTLAGTRQREQAALGEVVADGPKGQEEVDRREDHVDHGPGKYVALEVTTS